MHIDKASEIPIARNRCLVLQSSIDVLSWTKALDRLFEWAKIGDSRYVCICNVHSVVTALTDSSHHAAIEGADMATPDGAPLAWTIGLKLWDLQPRLNGPDMMIRVLERMNQTGGRIFLFGSTPKTLAGLSRFIERTFPEVQIVGQFSPPIYGDSFHDLEVHAAIINAARPHFVWVGLGCPKQEKWMHAQRGRINAVMVGVGAAFDIHAGLIKRAPMLVRSLGFEWLHRLVQEPKRLARRYIVTNSKFLYQTVVCEVLRRSR